MLNPSDVPDVDPHELLSRFVLTQRHINRQSGTLKADAFVPHPHDSLSVTRHLQATESEIWGIGARVASERGKTLYGRGDVMAASYAAQKLRCLKDPVPGNPNHVNVCGWPLNDKAAQKLIAMEIAAVAMFVARRAG
ncbi:MAG: hypothetical protein GYA33_15005 [Thermogutta sp.]|nr:hypothetical protein [Thermogutta sp.]